jgi:molecular chaperone HtpG
MTNSKSEHYEFNAEISKLMKMIIHNFYSSKEIFLRELISNSSDAIDKAKYNMINNYNSENLNDDFLNLKIKIYTNKENKCLTIEDTGIGMHKDDVINCLGTIAKSGTEEFVKNILNTKKTEKSDNLDLIGQFGVGFYSAFLVADKVQVLTKHMDAQDDNIIIWESNSTDGYNISFIENDDNNFKHGTKINLFLNDEQLEYLDENKLTEIIKKHSGYISYPILLLKKIKIEKPEDISKSSNNNADNADNEIDDDEDIEDINMDEIDKNLNHLKTDLTEGENINDEVEISDNKDNSDHKVENINKDNDVENGDNDKDVDVENGNNDDMKAKVDNIDSNNDSKTDEYKLEFVEINSKPIWTKDPKDVTEEEYKKLYSLISGDYGSYQSYKHFKAEGDIEFSAILFIPKQAPFNLFDNKKVNKNIKLYVKKVLITDECKDLYPEHFNFVTGIVDSNDLPLNASRELLQQSKIIKKINKVLVRKTLEMISELKENNDEFKNFYENFNKNIKLAIHEDSNNKTKLLNYLMFPTNKSSDKLISLDEYVLNMKDNQQGIYYIIGNSMDNIKNSAFIEKLKKKDYEVLLMCDPLDEYIMQQITEFNDKKFINVIKDDLKLDDETKEEDKEKHNELCTKIKEILGESITRVNISSKLDSHPMIVTSPMGWSANMERIIKAQALSNNNLPPYMLGQRVLEINPDHLLIKKLIESNYNKDQIDVLFNMAMLAGGYELNNVNDFLSKLYKSI